MEVNRITASIIAAAIDVHRELGPGLLESTYHACLRYELRRRGLRVEQQKVVPLVYKGVTIDCGYRLDLVVEGKVLVELKAVERIDRIHVAQVLTYLRLAGLRVGLLINFNATPLRNGLRRIVLGLREWPLRALRALR